MVINTPIGNNDDTIEDIVIENLAMLYIKYKAMY